MVFKIQVLLPEPSPPLPDEFALLLGEPFLAWCSDYAGSLFSFWLAGIDCLSALQEQEKRAAPLGREIHGQLLLQEKGKG